MSSLSNDNIKIFSPYFQKEDIVIVAALNWGLGHAARCIPIITWLNTFCKNVIIASDGSALDLLKKEFPDLQFYVLPSYHIRYKYQSILANVIFGLPSIIRAIYKENKMANQIVSETGATKIFSDNRLGFYSFVTRNYYMTHQLNILYRNSWIQKMGTLMHRRYIKKFNCCFVPDYNDERALCPALSNITFNNVHYVGPITRISKKSTENIYDILVLLSGPEPQRTIVENRLLEVLGELEEYKILFIRGTETMETLPTIFKHISFKSVLQTLEIETALNSSKLLISRSGYTTLMDIYQLDLKAIFIPTPGQTEQEYLADFQSNNPKYHKLNQNELNKLQKTIKSLI